MDTQILYAGDLKCPPGHSLEHLQGGFNSMIKHKKAKSVDNFENNYFNQIKGG
jgi:hypothetical protein